MKTTSPEELLASLRLSVGEVVRGLLTMVPAAVVLAPTMDAELDGDNVLLKLKIRGTVVNAIVVPVKVMLSGRGRVAVVSKFRPQIEQLHHAWRLGYNDANRLCGEAKKAEPKP